MGLKSDGDTLLRDYLRHTYPDADKGVVSKLKKHLTLRELVGLRLNITVAGGAKAVILMEQPEKLRKVLVVGRGTRPLLFRRSVG